MSSLLFWINSSPFPWVLWHNKLKKKRKKKWSPYLQFLKMFSKSKSQVNDKLIASCNLIEINLILVKLTKRYKPNKTRWHFNINTFLILNWDYYEVCFVFRRGRGENIFLYPCRGAVRTFLVSTTKVKHLYTTKTTTKKQLIFPYSLQYKIQVQLKLQILVKQRTRNSNSHTDR